MRRIFLIISPVIVFLILGIASLMLIDMSLKFFAYFVMAIFFSYYCFWDLLHFKLVERLKLEFLSSSPNNVIIGTNQRHHRNQSTSSSEPINVIIGTNQRHSQLDWESNSFQKTTVMQLPSLTDAKMSAPHQLLKLESTLLLKLVVK